MKLKLFILVFGMILLSLANVSSFDTYINNSNIFVNRGVGVGTNNISSALHVNGSIYIARENNGLIVDAAGSKRIGFMKYSGREAGIWRISNQNFEIGRVGNVTALPGSPSNYTIDFYVSGTGDIGIGTNNPSSLLDVNGSFSIVSRTFNSENGTVSRVGNDVVIAYSTTGTAAFSPPTGVTSVRVLVVAGGGGGGYNGGGGGGAGGMIHNTSYSVAAGTSYTITVGDGGAGSSSSSRGSQGSNSTFGTLTAIGGGGGGSRDGSQGAGGNGGSGGGGGGVDATQSGGTGTAGQGNDGGANAGTGGAQVAGGGGGAGTAGSDASGSNAGRGGNGTSNNITGTLTIYAGGGGGGETLNNNAAGGGTGGGGDGITNAAGNNGTDGLGGGGGGGSQGLGGGNGGSGIVIVGFTPASVQNSSDLAVDGIGYVGIGTSNPSTKLHVSVDMEGNILRLQDSDGTCNYNPESGSVTVSCSSDERLKENIRDSGSALIEFMKYRIRDYEIKESGDTTTGVIAQELREVFPERVSKTGGNILMAEQPNVWKIIKSIQELKMENDLLKKTLCDMGRVEWC